MNNYIINEMPTPVWRNLPNWTQNQVCLIRQFNFPIPALLDVDVFDRWKNG